MRQGRRKGTVTKSFCWLVRMEKKHYEMRQSYTTFLSFDESRFIIDFDCDCYHVHIPTRLLSLFS